MENESTSIQPTQGSSPIIIIVAVVGMLAGVLIGVTIGYNLSNPSDATTIDAVATSGKNNADYQAGFEAARAKLIEKGIIPTGIINQNVETLSIGGTVKKVSGNSLMVEVPSMDILGDPTMRTVLVTPDTAIYLLVSKTPEAMEAEMKDFMEKTTTLSNDDTTGGAPIEPPQSFVREKIILQNIKEGGVINISSANAIPPSGDITAKTIEIFPSSNPIGTPPAVPEV